MNPIFAILAGVTVGAAVAAMALRNLVHSVLCLTVSLVGLALLYLRLGAEFAGFVQILVYVGAVAILIMFAVLLTRGGEAPPGRIANAPWSGLAVAAAVFAMIAWAIARSPALRGMAKDPAQPPLSVKAIGDKLTGDLVLPLQVVALLLTAALVGGVVIAMSEKETE
ncbi:MAG: NADH-quinone oxidoreductase subunit J [Verrucomicrobia bacterium]|nr:MAG: NADH-quinone oxidoreductase subunit J [Verrucomicrobiota bacterium]